MPRSKPTVVTFKVDDEILDALRGVPNRSAFIRAAILAAIEGQCPVCRGTGRLTPAQRERWSRFARHHAIEECAECRDWHPVGRAQKPARRRSARPTARGRGR